MRRIIVGAWRDDSSGPMQVVSGPLGNERGHFEAPPARRIRSEIAAFLDWFNGNEPADLVLKAGVAHLWFVTIHPFEDGNGRIARAIADLLLARSEETSQRFYSMSARICDGQRALPTFPSPIRTDWISRRGFDGFSSVWIEPSTARRAFLPPFMRKAKFWEAHSGEQFNSRQRRMINRLLDGFEGKLTTSKWAKIAKCSQDTALRDIDDLVARRVIVRDPGGGRSTSYSLIANPADAMRAVAAHARAHARMFVRTAARTLTPEETDACRKQIDALADKLGRILRCIEFHHTPRRKLAQYGRDRNRCLAQLCP